MDLHRENGQLKRAIRSLRTSVFSLTVYIIYVICIYVKISLDRLFNKTYILYYIICHLNPYVNINIYNIYIPSFLFK